MKKKEVLVQTLCLPHCHYYKPGKNEELLCGGAVVIQRLIDADRNLSISERPRQIAGREVQEPIMQLVCGACEFRERDCDFAQDRRARPCGGVELISRLLKAGVITLEDIR